MKKFYTWLLLIIISSITITGIIPNIARAEEVGFIEVVAKYGIDGRFKQDKAIPVEVDIENKSETILSGTIEILVPNSLGNNDSYNTNIEVNAKEKKKFIVPTNPGMQNGTIKVRVKESDRIIDEKEVKFSGQPNNYTDALVGLITDDSKALEYIGDYRTVEENQGSMPIGAVNVAPLSLEFLSSNYKNMEILDVIIINNFDTSKLTDIMLKNISTWTENGGTLVIGGSEKTLNNLNKSFLNVSYSNPNIKWTNFKEGGANITLGTLSGDYGTVKLKDGDRILSSKIEKGTGDIIITSFDLGEKTFKEFEGVNNVLGKIVMDDYAIGLNNKMQGMSYPYEIENMLNTVPLENEIDISRAGVILIIFALISSFGGYFILKKLNKREILWVLIPILSIICTFIMFNLGKETSLKDTILNGINIIEVDKEGNGKINSYISIANKYKNDIKVGEPSGVRIEHMVKPNDNYMFSSGSGGEKIDVKTVFEGDKTYYELNDVGALDLKKFNVAGKETKVNKLESTLKYSTSGLSGSVKNTLGSDIEKLIVVFGNNIWDVGNLPKGEGYTFNDKECTSSSGIRLYGQILANKFYEGYYGGVKSVSEADKNIARIASLIGFAGQNASFIKPRIIALTKDNIDYGLSFETDSISKTSETVYSFAIDIDLKDSNGDTVYPPGYLVPTQESASAGVGMTLQDGNMVWGNGDVIVKYQFEDKFKAKEIIFKTVKSDNISMRDKVSEFGGAVEVFNFTTEKFESITLTDGVATLGDLKNYVSNGVFRVKYICKDEQGANAPVISVKGRFE